MKQQILRISIKLKKCLTISWVGNYDWLRDSGKRNYAECVTAVQEITSANLISDYTVLRDEDFKIRKERLVINSLCSLFLLSM